MIEKFERWMNTPGYIFTGLAHRGLLNWVPPRIMLKHIYKLRFNKKLDFNNPQSFNEKLQWLSLYDRKPEYTMMVDKYKVREYIKTKIGEEYLNDLLGVWDRPEDIDYDALPNQFVLKTNHASGGIVICKDKSNLDIKKANDILRKSLKRNGWYYSQEWPYKNVERKITAEKYLEQIVNGKEGLIDFKFYCFDGEPKFLYVCRETYFSDVGQDFMDFYDMEYNLLPVERPNIKKLNGEVEKPDTFDEMKRLAKILSSGHKFLRVDFYTVGKRIFFGELTFKPTAGLVVLSPPEYDLIWGSYLDISDMMNDGKHRKIVR